MTLLVHLKLWFELTSNDLPTSGCKACFFILLCCLFIYLFFNLPVGFDVLYIPVEYHFPQSLEVFLDLFLSSALCSVCCIPVTSVTCFSVLTIGLIEATDDSC